VPTYFAAVRIQQHNVDACTIFENDTPVTPAERSNHTNFLRLFVFKLEACTRQTDRQNQ